MAGKRTVSRGKKVVLGLATLLLMGAEGRADLSPVSLQDLQIAGRVLRFIDDHSSKVVSLAVVYDQANARSHDEAVAIGALLGTGLLVGELVLKPLLVSQDELAGAVGYGAIFATAGVNGALLQAATRLHQVPCLTGHLEQVEQGDCTIAIRSMPNVSIVVNGASATSAGVRFATAFRMMVREI